MPALLTTLGVAAALAASPPCAPGGGAPGPGEPAAAGRDGSLALVLNLPAYRLDVTDGRGTLRSYTVAVGSRRYRTPVGRYQVGSVELNPWWHPPDSDWARKEKVTPPGPGNPMGRAKLNFHELLFLHGTPLEASLGSASSHGCVRMANADALDLARRVLAAGRPDLSPPEIEAAVADAGRTRRYPLHVPVPIEVRYRTAEVRAGALELHPDVYRRERTPLRLRALEALRSAGMEAWDVDRAALDSAVRAASRGHVRVELARLTGGAGPPVEERPGPAPAAPGASGGIGGALPVEIARARRPAGIVMDVAMPRLAAPGRRGPTCS